MTRSEKIELVSQLQEEFASSEAIVVCDFKGLGVKQLEILRMSAKEKEVNVQVVKNTLARVALEKAGIQSLNFKDTNVFIWGKDQLAVTKVVAKFQEGNDLFKIKTAYIENEVASVEKVMALSKMPSRDELIAMLLQVWNAPLQNFVIGLNALKEKKAQESA